MAKILIIKGGGRPKGNTAQLTEAFARGALEAGNEVEIEKTSHLKEAYEFGRRIYAKEQR